MNKIPFLTTLANPTPWLISLRAAVSATLPQYTVVFPADDIPESEWRDVQVAIVADPPHDAFTKYPNLRLVTSLWAGVDGFIKSNPNFPSHSNAPTFIRLIDPEMSHSMAESALMHTLMIHRQIRGFRHNQHLQTWDKLGAHFKPSCTDVTVGVLGCGELGIASLKMLARHGFQVIGWGRRKRDRVVRWRFEETCVVSSSEATISSKSKSKDVDILFEYGDAGLETVLSRSDVVINLLPLTEETQNIFCRETFSKMKRGCSFINFGRGGHVNEHDLIEALDQGILDQAVLDVFVTEPLPSDSPFWSHPKVLVQPHVSALTNPKTASSVIANNIKRFLAGEDCIDGIVDWFLGY